MVINTSILRKNNYINNFNYSGDFMKNFRFLAMLMIMTMLAFTSCDNDDGGDSSKTYAIGDTGPSGVGIVFYVTDGGLHGLDNMM